MEKIEDNFKRGNWPLFSDAIENKFLSIKNKDQIFNRLKNYIKDVGPLYEGTLTKDFYK